MSYDLEDFMIKKLIRYFIVHTIQPPISSLNSTGFLFYFHKSLLSVVPGLIGRKRQQIN